MAQKTIQQIDAWTNDDKFVAALKFYYSDGTQSPVFGNERLVPTKPHSWVRRTDESITQLSIARFQGNLARQIYAIKLESTKQATYSVGEVQPDWPLESIWKSSDYGNAADIGHFVIDQYPTENNKWLVDIHPLTSAPGPDGVKFVKGHVVSQPAHDPGTNFLVTFNIGRDSYKYTGDHGGVITSPFEGDVQIAYYSVDDLVATPEFSGSVGLNQFHIEIDTETERKVIVDGTVVTVSKKGVPISGGGIWS